MTNEIVVTDDSENVDEIVADRCVQMMQRPCNGNFLLLPSLVQEILIFLHTDIPRNVTSHEAAHHVTMRGVLLLQKMNDMSPNKDAKTIKGPSIAPVLASFMSGMYFNKYRLVAYAIFSIIVGTTREFRTLHQSTRRVAFCVNAGAIAILAMYAKSSFLEQCMIGLASLAFYYFI